MGISSRSTNNEAILGVQSLITGLGIPDASASPSATYKFAAPYRARMPKLHAVIANADSNLRNMQFAVLNGSSALKVRRRARSGVAQRSFIDIGGTPAKGDTITTTFNGDKATGFSVVTAVRAINVDTSAAQVGAGETLELTFQGLTKITITNGAAPVGAVDFATQIVSDLNNNASFSGAGYVAAMRNDGATDCTVIVSGTTSAYTLTLTDNTAATIAEEAPTVAHMAEGLKQGINDDASAGALVSAGCDEDSLGTPNAASIGAVALTANATETPFKVETSVSGNCTTTDEESVYLPFDAEATDGMNALFSIGDDDDNQVEEFDVLSIVASVVDASPTSDPIDIGCTLSVFPYMTAYSRPEAKNATTMYTERNQV